MPGLSGQAVIVTGSGGGIGAACARAAAAEGARVVVNDIDAAGAEAVVADIRSAGGTAVAAIHDIRDPAEARALIGRCIAEFGEITGLVNNAALFANVPFEKDTAENLRAMLEVNVVGLFNCARAAIGATPGRWTWWPRRSTLRWGRCNCPPTSRSTISPRSRCERSFDALSGIGARA